MSGEIITKRDYIAEFREAFTFGIENITKAACIYVAAVDENPQLADAFMQEFKDWIPAAAWSGLEAVGRKWLHPCLIMGGGGRYSRQIKSLKYSDQERIFGGTRFDLVLEGGDTLKVDIREATADQVEQLIVDGHIRTLGEQRAWMESRKTTIAVECECESLPYSIGNGKVVFRRGVTMTKQEIRNILQAM